MKFLRIIRRGKWEKRPEPDWPEDSGLHCDALCDMRTKECLLSVYAITKTIDVIRVVVALAATRDEISLVDYVVFEDYGLKSFGIAVYQTEGETPDNGVNSSHYDLGNLTVKRLAQLTEIVSTGEYGRIMRCKIKVLLHDAVRNGLLDAKKVRSPKIQKYLMHDF